MPSNDPDQMAADFTQLVDDLAYAKTFYPSGKVTNYINSQASRIYLDIYKNRKEESNRLVTFWKYDLPLTIQKHHKVVLFSFIFFLIFFGIGYFVSAQNDDMARSIFGDTYVDHTQENIANGNPFGIYEHGNPFLSWLNLMIHNIRVSFLMFVSGIFAGIPCLYIAIKNSIMIGVFDQFFAARGLGIDFWLVVFVHGTLEITGLIIATAAGLVLGKSFLFPGTIKRIDAFKQGAKDGVKIMIGLIPVFALAAFFEGFITRLYNDISILTTAVFALSVLFVIWYFIIYPIRLGRKLLLNKNEEEV
ncbi:MAG: stage II sporulation protein M [Chitinophagaceae bacterium]|nr:stage II sporulation protein M [Chitinophagaceae bacterium]MBP6477357.1 stage II sporulation protein M [Chitinophagaceae bacterium]MBP7108424.1 stage II sporulation protein M [Chitinophagaceae bacterium]MBP7313859.1 stage II sporulation protein M [Chitinophagaceae bacterium]HQZ49328.1 stage II sporulation protein M [Chitinophagaceae bacterium]